MNFFYFLSVLCPYLLIKAWQNWPALFVQHQYFEVGLFGLPILPVANVTWPNWHASKEQVTFACRQAKMFLIQCLLTYNMLNKRCLKNLVVVKLQQAGTGCSNYVMSGKQCWSVSPDLKEQKHEFYPSVICLVTIFHLMHFKLTQP